jgi:hypothetical protein
MESISIAVGLSGTIVFLLLLAKMLQRTRFRPDGSEEQETAWSEEWFAEFSSFRYLPMRRLLADEDEEFFARSTNDSEDLRTEFRAERRRLFCQYLDLMQADFQRLSEGLKLAMIHAGEDQTPEVYRLLRMEWNFRKLLWMARLRVVFHWAGIRAIEPVELINALQGFEFGLREVLLHSAT